MPDKILIGLVEDQFLFREGMKAILNSFAGIKVVFEAENGHTVINKLAQSPAIPHVMLVDLSLPPDGKIDCNGIKVTEQLTEHYPEMKILILSVHNDDSFINQLIESGAHGYLVKDSNPQDVHEAIVSVYHKGSYIDERTLKALRNSRTRKTVHTKENMQITRREYEILKLVCQQHTAEEIAEILYISVKTVNGHRNNLLQKTGSRNATGLVLYAVKNNIISVI